MCVAAGYADYVVAMTSSHFASAEKQFRFPLEYANQRPKSATWTVTGSGAYVLGKKRSKARITGITTGKIVDYGIKDSMNMGAAMAPAASDVICRHLSDFGRNVTDYDKIITGDLGKVGQEILWDLTRTGGYDISSIHTDCGIEIYDADKQGTGRRRFRLRVCGSDALGTFYAADRGREMEKNPVCPDGSAALHRFL